MINSFVIDNIDYHVFQFIKFVAIHGVPQLSEFFDDIFSPHMSGFRKAHGCQDVLLNFYNNAKLSLDDRNVTFALLTDLSKAFDCLPYKLLIAKLHACCVDKNRVS